MKEKKKGRKDRFYTKHGQRIYLGKLVKVNGERALGYFKDDKIIGYTTLEEIREMSYKQELDEFHPDF